MAEDNASRGQSKSRSILDDLTNRIGKRTFSGREKNGVRCSDFDDKNVGKRICVSPRPCSEINSLKRNVISGLSKLPNENRDPNILGFGSDWAVSKSSTDVYDDCVGGHCLKGKAVVIGNSKFHGGHNDSKTSDFRGVSSVSEGVNELDNIGNNLIDSCDQIECSKDDDTPRIDKTASHNYLDPNLADLEGGKVLISPASADGRSQLDLESLKENMLSRTTELANDCKCPSSKHSFGKNVVDLTIVGGSEFLRGSSKMHNKENDPNLLDFGRSGVIQSINTESKDELDVSFSADTSKTLSETVNDCLHDGNFFDASEANRSLAGTQSDANSRQNDLDDHNADNFVLSQSGSIDCTMLPESQESRVFGIDRSTKPNEDECANMTVGTNSIQACSCSFCTKAAYMWLDLHQKDIKARASALKKSQKDASILAERSCRIKINEKYGAENVTRVSKLESHLMCQWRSLFQHMADIWGNEANQLEASLPPLNNLKDKYRADLELINSKKSQKH